MKDIIEITCYRCKNFKVIKEPFKDPEGMCKKEVWTDLEGDSYKHIMYWEGKCKKFEKQ